MKKIGKLFAIVMVLCMVSLSGGGKKASAEDLIPAGAYYDPDYPEWIFCFSENIDPCQGIFGYKAGELKKIQFEDMKYKNEFKELAKEERFDFGLLQENGMYKYTNKNYDLYYYFLMTEDGFDKIEFSTFSGFKRTHYYHLLKEYAKAALALKEMQDNADFLAHLGKVEELKAFTRKNLKKYKTLYSYLCSELDFEVGALQIDDNITDTRYLYNLTGKSEFILSKRCDYYLYYWTRPIRWFSSESEVEAYFKLEKLCDTLYPLLRQNKTQEWRKVLKNKSSETIISEYDDLSLLLKSMLNFFYLKVFDEWETRDDLNENEVGVEVWSDNSLFELLDAEYEEKLEDLFYFIELTYF